MLTHCLAAIDPLRECNFESGRGGNDQLSMLDSTWLATCSCRAPCCNARANGSHLLQAASTSFRCALLQGKYLIQGAAGSVLGRMLIQYAKHIGIKTINIVRRQEQIQELKDLG